MLSLLNLLNEKHIVNAIVRISGKPTSFVSLHIEQEYGQHHRFSLQLDRDVQGRAFIGDPSDQIGLMGKIVTIDLQHGNDVGNAYVFRGVITQVKMTGSEGRHGYIILEGASPTIMLERGKRMDVYSDMTLRRIFEEVTSGVDAEYLKMVNAPTYDRKLEFVMQYNETDWEFMRRIAYQYGENLFYSGSEILFGDYKEWESVALTYDKEITSLQFCSKMLPNQFTAYHYQSELDTIYENQSPDTIDGSNPYLDKAAECNNALTSGKPARQVSDAPVSTPDELSELSKRRKTRTAAQTVFVTGQAKTYTPSVGRLISVSMPDGIAGTKQLGIYRVVKSVHKIDQNHHYTNEFEAVPASLNTMPVDEPKMPNADSVQATVRSNDDPMGQGRVQVDFSFATQYSDIWLRVMSPDAGIGSNGAKNRGMVFVPEKGDQVMIGFELGDPNRPYVMGSMFHGANSVGGGGNNSIKSIITRSGIKIEFNDGSRSLHIEDPSGNTWHMDGNGSIQVYAPRNINLSAGDNIHFSAGRDITLSVGADLTANVANRAMFTATNETIFNTAVMRQMVANQYTMQAAKALINTESEIKIESREAYFAGMDKLFLHSDQTATLNSKGIAEMKGETKNSFDNKGINYQVTPKEITAKAIIHFRPKPDWKGDFGFDWMRIGDTGMSGDFAKYEDIVSNQYTNSNCKELEKDRNKTEGFFRKDPAMYEALKRKYDVHVVPWKTKQDASGRQTMEEYFCSWIALYPGREIEARLLIEVEEAVDSLKLVPSTSNFKVDIPDLGAFGVGKYEKIIKIKCEREISSDANISVEAYKKDAVGTMQFMGKAGKLNIWSNHAPKRKAEKVVFVSVQSDPKMEPKDVFDEMEFVNLYLNQALIELDPLSAAITLKADELTGFSRFLDDRRNIKAPEKNRELREFLEKKFNEKTRKEYISYFKVFFFNSSGSHLGGFSQGNFAAVFTNGDNLTAVHELFHTFNLGHSFSNETAHPFSKFTYVSKKTDNLMDYSNYTKSLWFWQWEIANAAVRKLAPSLAAEKEDNNINENDAPFLAGVKK